MESPQKMDVIDWQDSPPPVVAESRRVRRFLSPTFIGIVGTLLLHALVIRSVPFGSMGPKPKPPETHELANSFSKSAEHTDSLVLISLPTITNANQAVSESAISSLPDLSKIKIKSPIRADPQQLLNVETLALSEALASDPIASRTDGAEQARLFGIYTGQIQARIDRVWRRPRTPVNESAADEEPTDADESFLCQAQIIQDVRGNVQEILLPRCNGSPAWQRSLIAAIQHASPLPAPPSTNVFSHSITLSFIGLSYVSGSSADGYELEARTLARE
jgi:hypothetical protein